MTELTDPIRYPEGLTPHGEYHLLQGNLPCLSLWSPDDSIEFRLMGGTAAPFHDPKKPAIIIKSLKGLIPPWELIKQKGATQHGATTVANLFDPCEVSAELEIIGPDPKTTRRIVRDWIASNEQMETSELAWFTQELGRWWTDVRWLRTPPDLLRGAIHNRQTFTQFWQVDDAFWRSYDSVDNFTIAYDSDADTFDYVADDLGDDWEVDYSGTGGGYIKANGHDAVWIDDPEDPILTGGRTVACRRAEFDTDTDNQIVSIVLGSFPEWSFPDNASTYIWGRMNTASGDIGDVGTRVRIGLGLMVLSRFINGVEAVLRVKPILPPLPGETFTLVCGYEGNPFLYKVKRNGVDIMSCVDKGAMVGADYRGAGFGMHAGAAILTQATPASVRQWSAADNATITQSGHVKLINNGDQVMPPRYTCFGPGTFKFGNGPGSTEFVEFGPLLPNQVMQVRTDKELRPVVDMTSVPPTPQELNNFKQALKDFLSFATAGNVPPLLQKIESIFGIVPPQGHPYSLLSGSFSNPIPAKPRGKPAEYQHISVSITGGNADSMIIASGTPLRRYPL